LQRHYRVTVNGQTYDVTVEDAGAPSVGAARAPVPAEPPQAVPPSPGELPDPSPSRPSSGEGTVTAPLPGVVLDVKVRQGQRVAAGEVLLVLEAMKMENEITAPVGGQVERVAVKKGDTVNLGDPLVVIA
jgi:biotin carboxyl carrier protein